MSPEIIVGMITLVILALVSIAVTTQHIEKNRKERRRLESALLGRARMFEAMLSELPDGLLSNELKYLVCQCLIEVYEQLKELLPKQHGNNPGLNKAQATAEALRNNPSASSTIPDLTNIEQIKDIQQQLTALFKFIAKLRANNRINEEQAQRHAQQIRRLMLKTTLDLLNANAHMAMQSGKLRLAIHHYQTAINKIKKENETDFFSDHLSGYAARIEKLEEEIIERDNLQQQKIKKNQEAWDEKMETMNEEQDSWKKNTMYD